MRILPFLFLLIAFSSCWPKPKPYNTNPIHTYGFKPVLSSRVAAKEIRYIDSVFPVSFPGNIYAMGNTIYQLDIGKGIHIIDNSIPSQAHRTGFIRVYGSSQLSIKDHYLYTNSYNELVVLDIATPNTANIVSRVADAFPNGYTDYIYMEPLESGYYECPRESAYTDSVIVGWVKDSIWTTCYKN